jgi:hypothetical protein
MILSLFNKSEDLSSNNKIIEISIPLINFNKDEYELFSIFIHYFLNMLAFVGLRCLESIKN